MIQFLLNLNNSFPLILLILIYLLQLLLTELLIKVLNRIDPGYKRTNLHYFLPIIAPIVYILLIIEEVYYKLNE